MCVDRVEKTSSIYQRHCLCRDSAELLELAHCVQQHVEMGLWIPELRIAACYVRSCDSGVRKAGYDVVVAKAVVP